MIKSIKTIKLAMIAGMPLLLTSCFSAKEYHRSEELPAMEGKYRTDQLVQDSLSLATVHWEDLFTDPILQEHINQGLEKNMDIRIALQQIIAAEAYLKQGKAGYYPTLSGNASYMHQELSGNSQAGGSLDLYELSGNLSWEADIWGKIRSTDRAFQASYLQTVAAHQAVKTRLIANIASTYFQLLALDEQIAITEETITTRENSLETTRALKEAGNVSEVGVQQTEAQLYTAQAILLDVRNNARLLENTMAILLGEMPMDIERTSLESQVIDTELTTG